jgi:prepilin-type N-terminal cleavage/methylation domain-containing protein
VARSQDRTVVDGGFTMVEIVAALTVLAIGIVGVIGVMNGSFRVASSTSARMKATSIASEVMEAQRTADYNKIDATTGQTKTTKKTVAGREFSITEGVRWYDKTLGPNDVAGNYKQALVEVHWTDEEGPHWISQTTFIYPGGFGPNNPGGGFVATGAGSPLAPTNLVASIPPNMGTTTGVDLAWTPAVDQPDVEKVARWVIRIATDPAFTPGTYSEVTTSLSGDTPVIRITGLAPNTTYHFQVLSEAENGKLSTGAASAFNVTTQPSVALGCQVGLANVTPAFVKQKPGAVGAGLVTNPNVVVNTIGACPAMTFRIEYSARDGDTDSVLLTASGSNIWAGALDGDQAWTTGDHQIDVYDNLNQKRASISLRVCRFDIVGPCR